MDEVFFKIKGEILETVRGIFFLVELSVSNLIQYELFYRHIVFFFDQCEFCRGYVYLNYDGSLAL